MGRNLSASRLPVGEYIPGNSPIHNMLPEVKIICGFFFITGAVAGSDITGMLLLFVFSLFGFILSGIPLRRFAGAVKLLTIFLLIIGLFQVFLIPANDGFTEYFRWRWIAVTAGDFRSLGITVLRFFSLVFAFILLGATLPVTQIDKGAARLLKPLEKIGFPSAAAVTAIAVTFHFVPIMTEEADRLMKAQRARGFDVDRKKRNVFTRVFAYFPVFIPLFIRGLNRAERLAEAMEVRGFTGTNAIAKNFRKLQTRDYTALVLTVFISAVVIVLGVIDGDLKLIL
ncbi:MAG: energy-coupling factor transporter transmembrane component T family protein [Spirochaetia bacterium]